MVRWRESAVEREGVGGGKGIEEGRQGEMEEVPD